MKLWVVESKVIKVQENDEWTPILTYPHIRGIYKTRKLARIAAKDMFNDNANNKNGKRIVLYRAVKYVREKL